jgi:transcriptional regulator with XRE-family HTH domain
LNIHIALRQIREKKGLSQEKLSELAGLDRTYISLIECGKRKPSLETIEKICHVFSFKVWELLKHINEKNCEVPFNTETETDL